MMFQGKTPEGTYSDLRGLLQRSEGSFQGISDPYKPTPARGSFQGVFPWDIIDGP